MDGRACVKFPGPGQWVDRSCAGGPDMAAALDQKHEQSAAQNDRRAGQDMARRQIVEDRPAPKNRPGERRIFKGRQRRRRRAAQTFEQKELADAADETEDDETLPPPGYDSADNIVLPLSNRRTVRVAPLFPDVVDEHPAHRALSDTPPPPQAAAVRMISEPPIPREEPEEPIAIEALTPAPLPKIEQPQVANVSPREKVASKATKKDGV